MKTPSNTNIITITLTQPPSLEPKTLHQPPSSSRELHLCHHPQFVNPLLRMFLEKERDGKKMTNRKGACARRNGIRWPSRERNCGFIGDRPSTPPSVSFKSNWLCAIFVVLLNP